MRLQNILPFLLCSLIFGTSGLVQLQAQRAHHPHKAERQAAVHRHPHKKARVIKRFNRSRVVVVKRRRGRIVSVLPKGAFRVPFNNVDYHFHAGRYYRGNASRYMVVIPPRGVRVRVLPPKARRFMWNKRPYFYYAGTYYVQKEQEYETVPAEEGMVVPDLPEDLVEEIKIDEQTYYEVDNLLYQRMEEGYQVVGELED